MEEEAGELGTELVGEESTEELLPPPQLPPAEELEESEYSEWDCIMLAGEAPAPAAAV